MEHKEEWERISFLNYKYKINQGWKIKNVNKKKNAHRQLIVRIVIKDPKRGTNDRSIFDYTTATQRRGRHENIFASNKCQPRHRTKRQNDNLLADMGQSISPRPSCFLIFHRSQPDGPLSSSARIYPSGGCKNSSPSFPRSSSTIVTRHPGESTMKKEEKWAEGGGGEKIARAITLPLCFVSTGKHYAIQRVNEFPFFFVFVRFLCSVQGDFLLSLFFNEKLS